MTVQELAAAVDCTGGLVRSATPLHPWEPDRATRAAVLATLQPGHHMTTGLEPVELSRWPIHGARGGMIVLWNPDELRPKAVQRHVCGTLLRAKCDGAQRWMATFWAPSFVLTADGAYLIDGHHGIELITRARRLGMCPEQLPAFVHLPGGDPLAVPRLDCDCPRLPPPDRSGPT